MRLHNANQSALRARTARLLTVLCACLMALAVRNLYADDIARYFAEAEDGSFEETTVSGKIVGMTAELVQVKTDDGKTTDIPATQMRWIFYEDAPLDLAAARVEIEVGNFEAALDKLNAIAAADVDREKKPLIAAEYEWYKIEATLGLAFADAKSFSDGGKAAVAFTKDFADHYRLYDAYEALGDAYFAMSATAKDKSTLVQRANDAFKKMTESKLHGYQARGKLGLAGAALADGKLDDAEKLYGELVRDESLGAEAGEFDVAVEAKLGLAAALAEKSKFDDAKKALEALLSETPNSSTRQQARIYNALGNVCARAGQLEDAIIAYLHVDLLYPAARTERVVALKALVGLWRETNRPDRADETVERLQTRFGVKVE